MTREEKAIERLKTDIYKYADFTENPNENEFWMAFDMAIKALEQQTCEDAVNRAHVMLIVQEFLNNSTYDEEMLVNDLNKLHSVQPEQQACEDAVSREAVLGLFAQNADATRPYHKTWSEVKALPSVKPQPKTGHWIEHDHGFDTKYYQCPICKGYDGSPKGKYCKWCGAKMIEPQERSDEE